MPVLRRGKYSNHSRISTDSSLDELEDDEGISVDIPRASACQSTFGVMYIAQENLNIFTPQVFADTLDKLYSKHLSKISSLILKKYRLQHDEKGISILEKSSSKRCTFYDVNDIAYMIQPTNREKTFAIVLKYGNSKGSLHAYLSSDNTKVKQLLDAFRKDVEKTFETKDMPANLDCSGYELIHRSAINDDVATISSSLQPPSIQHNPASKEFASFEVTDNFRKANSSSPIVKEISKSLKENIASFSPKLLSRNKYAALSSADADEQMIVSGDNYLRDGYIESNQSIDIINKTDNAFIIDELDDGFTDLAKKRNPYNPEHLQDKSIESTLLMQTGKNDKCENITQTSDIPTSPNQDNFMSFNNNFTAVDNDGEKMRRGFFSSYSKLSDGSNFIK